MKKILKNRAFSEISRKSFHLLILLLPIIYHFTNESLFFSFLIACLTVSILFDLSRLYSTKMRKFFSIYLSMLLREHEKKVENFCGATYAFAGALFVAFFYDAVIFTSSIIALAVGDSFASYGHRIVKLNNKKSINGLILFIISSVFVISIYFLIAGTGRGYWFAMVPAISIAGITEYYSRKLRVDDNLLIPVSYAITCGMFLSLYNSINLVTS